MDLVDLATHSGVVETLRREVEARDEWRWLELSCSLAVGRGDQLSDVDVGIGYRLRPDEVASLGLALVDKIGPSLGVLMHSESSWPEGILRFAVEYEIGIQLDLVLMPAEHRLGLPEESVALVDKDGHLSEIWTPPVATAEDEQVREWVMLGWWALSNVAKYVRRNSLFEALEALQEARTQTLRTFAASRAVRYPSFGLTSLLDFEPFELPDGLAATYSTPDDAASVIDAAWALADLLDVTADEAGNVTGITLATQWSTVARDRLRAAGSQHDPPSTR